MKKPFQAGVLAVALLFGANPPLPAQTWTGPNNGSWGTAANWSPASVPNAVDAVANINAALTVDVQNTGTGGNFPYTIGTLASSVSGNVVIGNPGNSGEQLNAQTSSGSPTFSVSNSGGEIWWYSILNGTQGFAKTGPGKMTFRYNSGSQNFSGPVVVSAGTLGFQGDGNFGNATNGITIAGGAALTMENSANAGSFALGAARTITLAGTSAQISVGNSADTLVIPGPINQSLAGSSLLWTGSGMMVLSGSNSYSGGTTINAGTLSVSAARNLGASGGGVTFNGGGLQITGTGLTNFSGSGHPATFASGKSVTLDINTAGNIFTADSVLSQGTGGLTKLGAGALALNQLNTYTGITTISAGTLALVAGGSLANGSSLNLADGTTLDVSGLGTYTLGSSASLTASSTGVAATINGGSGGVVNLGTRPITLNYNLLNPALVIASGTLALQRSDHHREYGATAGQWHLQSDSSHEWKSGSVRNLRRGGQRDKRRDGPHDQFHHERRDCVCAVDHQRLHQLHRLSGRQRVAR